jgi:competence protein ComEC
MPSRYKLLIIIVTLIAIGAGVFFWLYRESPQQLEVIFMDIGQGDAILIKTPYDQQILIDGGPDNTVLNRLGEHLPFWDKTIDLMILTHPHDDHVGGLVSVVDRYQVNQIYYTGVLHTSPNYLAWLEKIDQKGIPLKIMKIGDKVTLGDDLILDTLFPFQDLTDQEVDDLNGTSIVNRLVYGQHSFLLTGDLTSVQEEEILQKRLIIESDVLKVGHHGSKYSSSPDFLEAVDPQYAIIQVGQDNRFGHPHLLTIQNLENADAVILRNDRQGDIKCQSDKVVLSCF